MSGIDPENLDFTDPNSFHLVEDWLRAVAANLEATRVTTVDHLGVRDVRLKVMTVAALTDLGRRVGKMAEQVAIQSDPADYRLGANYRP